MDLKHLSYLLAMFISDASNESHLADDVADQQLDKESIVGATKNPELLCFGHACWVLVKEQPTPTYNSFP